MGKLGNPPPLEGGERPFKSDRSDHLHHTVYITTNLKNGKIYIGSHITTDPNDKYLGSGMLLIKAVKEVKSRKVGQEVGFKKKGQPGGCPKLVEEETNSI